MSEVRVRNLSLAYGATKALDDVSLDFPDGQLFGLLGPSGSGKTTLLRCIAGFVFPDHGSVMTRVADAPGRSTTPTSWAPTGRMAGTA